jgi:hypothetical protein
MLSRQFNGERFFISTNGTENRINLNLNLTVIGNNQFKWFKDLSVTAKTIKFLEESRNKSSSTWMRQWLLKSDNKGTRN